VSEDNIIARPYAKAAFDFAVKSGQVQQWATCLHILSLLATNNKVQSLIKDPKVHRDKIHALFKDIAAMGNNKHLNNFLNLLMYYKRLLLLPAIHVLFNAYCAEREQQVVAKVISAEVLSARQQTQLQQSLAKRFAKHVILDCHQDKNLIGGAIIRVGDTVIDGSVKGQLYRLTQHLEMKEKICQ
jgi:F-type H+-transporting ATPase subunit delta